jgi:hypothetical protein
VALEGGARTCAQALCVHIDMLRMKAASLGSFWALLGLIFCTSTTGARGAAGGAGGERASEEGTWRRKVPRAYCPQESARGIEKRRRKCVYVYDVLSLCAHRFRYTYMRYEIHVHEIHIQMRVLPARICAR